jgi:hypothetical protein
MARLFSDTCGDHYDIGTILDWWSSTNGSGASVVSGLSGATNNCILLVPYQSGDLYYRKNLPSSPTRLITGGRFQTVMLPASGNNIIFGWWDSLGNFQCGLFVTPSGSLALCSDYPTGSSIIAQTSAPNIVQSSNFCYIQADIAFATSGASIAIHVNANTVLTASGLATAVNGNGAGMFSIHSGRNSSPQQYFDDLYVNDITGSANNSFDGDQEALFFPPSAAGQYTQWSIGGSSPAATNWQSVSKTVPNGDVSYVSAASTGLKDTYKVGSLPANVVTIVNVATVLNVKTDAGGLGAGATVAPMIGNGSTTSTGSNYSPNTTYTDTAQYFGTNPLTSSAWALPDWTNIEIGQTRTN